MVRPGGGHLERTASEREPAHVAQIERLVVDRVVVVRAGRVPLGPGRFALDAARAARRGDRAPRTCTSRTSAASAAFAERHDHRLGARAGQHVDQRQRAGHRAHRPVEPELAEHADAVERAGGQLVARGQQAERDRELEPGAGLAHCAGREVHRDALLRPGKP